VFADLAVVSHVDQIIQLHTLANTRIVQRPAIDRGIGANLHVIANLHNPNLRKFPIAFLAARISKSVGANDRSGVNFDSVSHPHAAI
jgi:hypothetical protein